MAPTPLQQRLEPRDAHHRHYGAGGLVGSLDSNDDVSSEAIDVRPRAPHPFSISQYTAGSMPNLAAAALGNLSMKTMSWYILNATLVLLITQLLAVAGKAQADLFFLYYQPFTPILAMFWFWGLNVKYFEKNHIRYDACFSPEDQKFLLPASSIFQVANFLTTIVLTSATIFLFYCVRGQLELAAYQPPGIYVIMLVLLLFPGRLLFQDTRRFFASTLWRVATPVRSVTWADFLLADILTSLAKAVSDIERSVCHLMTGDVMAPEGEICSDGSWIIPLGLALPYAWRLLQCIRVYLDTGARPQLFNAIKYSTAFPVIIMSAVKYHVPLAAWETTYKPMWLACAFINSAYSYYWDIERDWEISFFSQIGQQQQSFAKGMPLPAFPSNIIYSKLFYYYLMISNFALRLSWIYKLSPHLRRNHSAVFFIVLLEAFRRFQWIFVRIEVELRKLQALKPELGELMPHHSGAQVSHRSHSLASLGGAVKSDGKAKEDDP